MFFGYISHIFISFLYPLFIAHHKWVFVVQITDENSRFFWLFICKKIIFWFSHKSPCDFVYVFCWIKWQINLDKRQIFQSSSMLRFTTKFCDTCIHNIVTCKWDVMLVCYRLTFLKQRNELEKKVKRVLRSFCLFRKGNN